MASCDGNASGQEIQVDGAYCIIEQYPDVAELAELVIAIAEVAAGLYGSNPVAESK